MSNDINLGGYPIDWFVEIPDGDFLCGICFDVLKNPRQCPAGHMFCLSCLSLSFKNRSTCPECNTRLTVSTLSVSLGFRNLIDKLNVKCPNKTCTWTIALENREAHLSVCDEQLIDCQLQKHKCCISTCNGNVLRGAEAEHLAIIRTEHSEAVFPKMLSKINHLTDELSIMRNIATIGYMGERKNNLKDGTGFEKVDNDTFYTGSFRLDKRQGHGSLTTARYHYVGDFVNGAYYGTGTMHWIEGDVCVGEWVNGLRHGHGKYTFANGNSFEGQWDGGTMSGMGRMSYVDGSVHKGMWKDNKICGKGIHTGVSGDTFDGVFENNQMMEGYVKWTLPNGCIYEGNVVYNPTSGVLERKRLGRVVNENGNASGYQWDNRDTLSLCAVSNNNGCEGNCVTRSSTLNTGGVSHIGLAAHRMLSHPCVIPTIAQYSKVIFSHPDRKH